MNKRKLGLNKELLTADILGDLDGGTATIGCTLFCSIQTFNTNCPTQNALCGTGGCGTGNCGTGIQCVNTRNCGPLSIATAECGSIPSE
jgi:hypothetical protein